MRYYNYFPPYVSVAKKKAKAARQIAQLRKKGIDISPIEIQGRAIAKNWWGKSWCDNLERYADYSNRIPRGRSYVRNGMVLDLQIGKGLITALVAGTSVKPYEIKIKIAALPAEAWAAILEKAGGQIESVEKLLEGKFPEAFKKLFFQETAGLFPTPSQITLDCSCPDWANMCKHVTAALLGVGARLDEQPELFFTLRKLDLTELTARVIKKQAGKLLKKSDTKSKRSLEMDAGGLEELFGVSLEETTQPKISRKKSSTQKKKQVKKVAKKKTAKASLKTVRKAVKKRVKKKTTKKATGKASNKQEKKTVKKAMTKVAKRKIIKAVSKNSKPAVKKAVKKVTKKAVKKTTRKVAATKKSARKKRVARRH